MKHWKRAWIPFCALALLVFSGCSYKDLDEHLQGAIQQVGGAGDQTTIENPPMPEDQIEYKGIEGTFSAYKKYAVYV